MSDHTTSRQPMGLSELIAHAEEAGWTYDPVESGDTGDLALLSKESERLTAHRQLTVYEDHIRFEGGSRGLVPEWDNGSLEQLFLAGASDHDGEDAAILAAARASVLAEYDEDPNYIEEARRDVGNSRATMRDADRGAVLAEGVLRKCFASHYKKRDHIDQELPEGMEQATFD